MLTLRLRQTTEGDNRFCVYLELEGAGARRTAESRFEFQLTGQEQEDLPGLPPVSTRLCPTIAARSWKILSSGPIRHHLSDKHTRWNSVNMGPKKDVVRLFRKATLEQDLKFGVSEHLWRQLGLNKRFRARRGNNTDPPD